MANNYHGTTGVLRLATVTPIIRALFGGLSLDETYPGNGEVYICSMSEEASLRWTDVIEGFKAVATDLGVTWKGANDRALEEGGEVIWALAKHFDVSQANLDRLNPYIEETSFQGDDTPDLETLLYFAQVFDDGHGLKSIVTETGWYCDKPRLFEFGGSGSFIGSRCTVHGTSADFVIFGERLEDALAEDKMDAAAIAIADLAVRMLNGIHDVKARLRTQRALAARIKTVDLT